MIQNFSEFTITSPENVVGGRRKNRGKRRRRRRNKLNFANFPGGGCSGMGEPAVTPEEAIEMQVAEIEAVALETINIEDDSDIAVVLIEF